MFRPLRTFCRGEMDVSFSGVTCCSARGLLDVYSSSATGVRVSVGVGTVGGRGWLAGTVGGWRWGSGEGVLFIFLVGVGACDVVLSIIILIAV